uniref:Uncharacterized protein n=1 Tax=Rhodopseudomonas palustris (strain BisA53) TaxID=316055 RepID=Q07NK5_RHOP5
MAAANDDKSNEIGYDFRRRLSARIVWWSKSREEPGAHKQRHPVATTISLTKTGNRAEKFFEQGLHPALFFCVDGYSGPTKRRSHCGIDAATAERALRGYSGKPISFDSRSMLK